MGECCVCALEKSQKLRKSRMGSRLVGLGMRVGEEGGGRREEGGGRREEGGGREKRLRDGEGAG